MLIATDEKIRASVEKHIIGTIELQEYETDMSVIDGYFNHKKHYNYVIDEDINGFLCCTEYEEYIVVNFAWFNGTFANRKKMIKLGKDIFKKYTIGKNKPMIYSGKINFYPNHSITISDKVWQFMV